MARTGGPYDRDDLDAGAVAIEIGAADDFIEHAVDLPGLHELVARRAAGNLDRFHPHTGRFKKLLFFSHVVRQAVDDRQQGDSQRRPGRCRGGRNGQQAEAQTNEQGNIRSKSGVNTSTH